MTALSFDPTGKYFAVGLGRRIEIWHTPSTPGSNEDGEVEFAPFVKYHTHTGHHDDVQSIEWSSDSRFFLSASKDLTARVWSLRPEENFTPTTLAAHRESIRGAWFSADQESIYTVSQDGALCQWQYVTRNGEDEDEPDENSLRWRVVNRHYFMQNHAKTTCATFHASSGLLVVGFSNGIFGLYELPDFNVLHTLSISQNSIDFVSVNQSGEWLAFGASKMGQLLVWEWQSESYILKQQGHFDATNAITYTPDSQQIISTADDGKIKVWDVHSGFCTVTFTEHSGAVTACEFAKRGRILFTASLDGSVRAWDMIRYRNFRTFTAPTRLSFSSLAIDPSGEVVCAGSIDAFEIYVWSVQTGQLLDQLSGHEGPISSLAFAPNGSSLISGSWDHTVRIWNIFDRTQTSEPLSLQADILAVTVRPDSKQIAVATLDGELTFWSLSEAMQEAGVSGRRDVSGGRLLTDRRTAASSAGNKAFTSIAYSVDGTCLLAGGNSKYLCLYAISTLTLLKKFTVSINLSLSGTQEFLNSKLLTEAGPAALIDTTGEASDLEDRLDSTLPGTTRGDAGSRRTPPAVRVTAVSFATTGRSFCAASTEGLLVYSLDTTLTFDPFDLDIDVTPATTIATLEKKEYLVALVMAFRLNDGNLIRRVYESIPHSNISLLAKDVPSIYLGRLLSFVAAELESSAHLEFNLLWLQSLLSIHGIWFKEHSGTLAAELRASQRAINRVTNELGRIAEGNVYAVDFVLQQAKLRNMKTNGISTNGTSVLGDGDVSLDEVVITT